MTEITNFNIRVYGIVINRKNELLISSERYKNRTLHKFIGGGLEKGEGIKQALEREFMEEIECQITVGELYYVNDFLQVSFFKPEDQIISIYYFVEPKDWTKFNAMATSKKLNQTFKWHNLKTFETEQLSLPIDKIVVSKLKSRT